VEDEDDGGDQSSEYIYVGYIGHIGNIYCQQYDVDESYRGKYNMSQLYRGPYRSLVEELLGWQL
jgi:hypothetical protein